MQNSSYNPSDSKNISRLSPPRSINSKSFDTFAPVGDSKSAEGSLFKLDLGIPKISEFIQQLQEQIQRINPSFVFKYSPEPPLTQTIKLLTQAIDSFLEKYSKLLVNSKNFRPKGQFEEEESNLSHHERKNNAKEIENAKETMKNLCKYEILLKKKEENLREEKEKLNEELENLRIIDENIAETKSFLEKEKTLWLESKKQEMEKIESDKKKILGEREEIQKIIEELKLTKAKIDKQHLENLNGLKLKEEELQVKEKVIASAQEDLFLEKNKLSQEKIKFEQAKWKFDQQQNKFSEQESLFLIKLEHFNLEKTQFDQLKLELSQDRINFNEEKLKFSKEKDSFLTEKNILDDSEYKFGNSHQEMISLNISNENSIAYLDFKSQELAERENEIETAYYDLNEQISKFNKEFEEREKILHKENEDLAQKKLDFEKKIEEFNVIEACLIESKAQIEEFRLATIPEFENQSILMQELMKSLLEEKSKIEKMIKRLNKDIVYLGKMKGNLGVIQEANSECSSDDSPDIEKLLESIGKSFGKDFEEIM